MAAISDSIERFIRELFDDESRQVEIQRNELAQLFHCAPSQINYVLSTRFTLDRGYVIQSRRGGGGYIRIIRMDFGGEDRFFDTMMQKIGDAADERKATHIVECIYSEGLVDDDACRMMMAAVSDKALAPAAQVRDLVRANLLKAFVLAVAKK